MSPSPPLPLLISSPTSLCTPNCGYKHFKLQTQTEPTGSPVILVTRLLIVLCFPSFHLGLCPSSPIFPCSRQLFLPCSLCLAVIWVPIKTEWGNRCPSGKEAQVVRQVKCYLKSREKGQDTQRGSHLCCYHQVHGAPYIHQ